MKLKFKFIPFMISLLIVVGITFGICWYSYHGYEGNKLKYLNSYFHVDDYESQSASELINHAVKMQTTKFQKGSNLVSFSNPDDDVIIPTDKEGNSSYYQNGTLHLNGFFDVDIYTQGTLSQGKWTYNYYFYFYNINYKNSSFDPEKLQMLVVQGTGRATEEEKEEENYTPYGDDLLDKCYEEFFDDDTKNNPSLTAGAFSYYTYTGENEQTSHYYIYDTGFKNDDNREEGAKHLVYRMSPKTDNNHNSITDSEKNTSGDVTFCIFYNESNNKDYKIVKGVIKDITNIDKIEHEDGYNNNPLNAPEYKKVILGKVILHGSIAFVLSGIVAFLFYLIWMDPSQEELTKKNKNKR